MGSDAPTRSSALVWRAVAVIAVTVVAAGVCGWLGVWQWDRAHSRATVVREEAPRPIADVLSPSSDATEAVGRSVTVRGTWGDDAAIVWGREVNGTPAAFLVRSLVVPAAETGTGEQATLAVIVGYRPSDDAACPDPGGSVTVTGYLKASEAPPVGAGRGEPSVCGTPGTDVVSTAQLARTWTGPMYSAVLVSGDGSASWTPLPPREPITRLNLQSLVYAAEWWAFGVFAVVLAARWVRDNGRVVTTGEAGETND